MNSISNSKIKHFAAIILIISFVFMLVCCGSKKEPESTDDVQVADTVAEETTQLVLPDLMALYKQKLIDLSNDPSELGNEFTMDLQSFDIVDVTNDGIIDLILKIDCVPMAEMRGYIYTYSPEQDSVIQLSQVSVGNEYYKNGYIVGSGARNFSETSMTIWPYIVRDGINSDSVLYQGYSCDKEACEYSDVIFPAADDKDNDGVIYYFGDASAESLPPLTLEEYEAEVNKVIPESEKIVINYKNITAENIEAIK